MRGSRVEVAGKLTPRQAAVAALVRRKWTSRQIAEKLGISRRTVEVHRANIALRTRTAQSNEPPSRGTVQWSVHRLSKQVAKLVAELDQLRHPRAVGKVRVASQVSRSAAINSAASRRL
jgi:DNA-binding CsgD family transcriptional regulator